MITAGQLLKIWSFRLGMHKDGTARPWEPTLRRSVERLIENLTIIPEDEAIEIDADENRNPIARFIRATTGEVIGEINKPPD